MKALIIDDYQEHVDTLVQTLIQYGIDARGAATAREAFVILETFEPDLIVCDGLLADCRAWHFGHQYLQEYIYGRNTHRPYLVALTGFGSTLQRRLCEECGFNEYVTKPIELSTLLGWIQKARELVEGNSPS